MKQLLFSTCLLLLCFPSTAQITISSVPNVPTGKIDSCAVPTTAGLAAMSVSAPSTNASWSLSGVALQSTPARYTYKAKTAGFSSASFSDSLSFDFGSTIGSVYSSWRNVQQSSTSLNALGEEILKRQAKGIGGTTGNTLDSIVFPTQVVAYSNALPIIKLPATMSSKWSATANRTVSFNLTVTGAAMNNTPGQHKQIITSIDSVVGWGRMKVPVIGKTASAWIPVLQVHHSDVALDSFFLNGTPAPALVLGPLGLAQGQSTTLARTLFYRSGAFRPLIEAVHSSPSHSSGVARAYIHADDIPEDLGVNNAPLPNVSIFPNPVSTGKLQVSIPAGNDGSWHYSVTGINGHELTTGTWVIAGAQTKEIRLPQGLPAGTYLVSLQSSRLQSLVLPVELR